MSSASWSTRTRFYQVCGSRRLRCQFRRVNKSRNFERSQYRTMKISVFGLGYVGCVSAACLAQDGHQVIGIDVNEVKLDQVRRGQPPVVEPGLEELLGRVVRTSRLTVSTNASAAVDETDVSVICVGTPSKPNGSVQLDNVLHVCCQIAEAIRTKRTFHVVIVRSTVLPTTVEGVVIPELERHSGKKAGRDFGVCMNPEFLREGSALSDYYNPGHCVIGVADEKTITIVTEIYRSIDAQLFVVSIRTAEMVKYVSNAFHALKIAFANEVGVLSKYQGVDGRQVREIVCSDSRLNISPAYLKPGFAFGGSCLTKDVRALAHRARMLDLECQLLNSIIPSNEHHIDLSIEMVERTGKKRVGILGLSFKAGTDDLRESPAVRLAETLFGKGYEIAIFDENVDISRLVGANRTFIDRELPHIASLMCASIEETVRRSEVVVVTNWSKAFRRAVSLMNADQVLIDLVGVVKRETDVCVPYEGSGW